MRVMRTMVLALLALGLLPVTAQAWIRSPATAFGKLPPGLGPEGGERVRVDEVERPQQLAELAVARFQLFGCGMRHGGRGIAGLFVARVGEPRQRDPRRDRLRSPRGPRERDGAPRSPSSRRGPLHPGE